MNRSIKQVPIMHRLRRLMIATATFALSLQLTGCAQMAMTLPMASIQNTAKLRGGALTPAAVGSFKLDASKDSSLDKSVSIRTNHLSSPVEESFAQYLRETLRVELQSAGLLDPNASTVIAGTLTESAVDSPVGTGTASLAARFVVTRAAAVRYDRELRVHATWESHFLGVSAIPQAAGHYEALYRKLVAMLFDDTSFHRALTEN